MAEMPLSFPVSFHLKSPVIHAERYHDFSCGHRVHNHEGKCALLHGHNYRAHFLIEAEELDSVGRVLDFSVIKNLLCEWLEEHYDHRFLVWDQDDLMTDLMQSFQNSAYSGAEVHAMLAQSIVWVPYNPTAENIAKHLLMVVGPEQLRNTGAKLVRVRIDETRKCSAIAII